MNMLRTSILLLVLMAAAPFNLQAQSLYIQPSSRNAPNACATMGGTWSSSPVPTCTFTAFFQDEGQTLTIRRGARVIVRRQFINYGTIFVGDPNDPRSASASSSAMLILGETIGGQAGVNGGVIYVRPHPDGGSATLTSNLGQFVNTNTIYIQAGNADQGILANYGTIFNGGRIINRGFLFNSGPPVQRQRAKISSPAPAYLSNARGIGVMRNLGTIEGRVIGECTGVCRPDVVAR
jgi:hypothetical protein